MSVVTAERLQLAQGTPEFGRLAATYATQCLRVQVVALSRLTLGQRSEMLARVEKFSEILLLLQKMSTRWGKIFNPQQVDIRETLESCILTYLDGHQLDWLEMAYKLSFDHRCAAEPGTDLTEVEAVERQLILIAARVKGLGLPDSFLNKLPVHVIEMNFSKLFEQFVTHYFEADLFERLGGGDGEGTSLDGASVLQPFLDKTLVLRDWMLSLDVPSVNEEAIRSLVINHFVHCCVQHLYTMVIALPACKQILLELDGVVVADDKKFILRVVNQLTVDFNDRVLQQGVPTTQILDVYINLMELMDILANKDTANYVLDHLSPLFLDFLKGRDDSMKCIIAAMVNDSLLSRQLFAPSLRMAGGEDGGGDAGLSSNLLSPSFGASSRVVISLGVGLNWVPDPKYRVRLPASRDFIRSLIDIYGSRKSFLAEYKNQLGERLIQEGTGMNKEKACLDLLKGRFPDTDFNNCELMIDDLMFSASILGPDAEVVSVSRLRLRINKLRSRIALLGDNFELRPVIISEAFWPIFKSAEELQQPPEMKPIFSAIRSNYEQLKKNRTIEWLPHLGLVQLHIELPTGRVFDVQCQPYMFYVLVAFSESAAAAKTEWSLQDLAAHLGTPTTALRRRLAYWCNKGVLHHKSDDLFEIQTSNEVQQLSSSLLEEKESVMESTEDRSNLELQRFWLYIIGFLRNCESLRPERIMGMLKHFVRNCEYEVSLEQLRRFLDKQVASGQLLCVNGSYKLKKKDYAPGESCD